MLKFERLSKETVVSIRVKERSSFLDKALLQALIWSFVFHLVLFGTFRIRYNSFLDSSPPLKPIAVAIDPELTSDTFAITALADIDESLDNASAFFHTVDENEWKMSCIQNLLPPTSNNCSYLPSPTLSHLSQDDVSMLAKEITYAPIVYPLQLKLSRSLKNLYLVDDGSALFKTKGPYDDLGRYALSTKLSPIDYKVKVDGKTGTIVGWQRTYELLDKELQKVADTLITKIRFAPFSHKSQRGTITMSFCCSGEEIGELLDD